MSAAAAQLYRGDARFEANLRHQTFADLIDARSSDQRPYCSFHDGGKLVETVTFAEFAARCRGGAAVLAGAHGVGKGDPVIVVAGNAIDTLVAFGALLYLGAVVVPFNPDETQDFFRFVAGDVKPAGVLFEGPLDAFPVPDGAFKLPLASVARPAAAPAGDVPGASTARGGNARMPATVMFTSGSTGRAKGVPHPIGDWFMNSEAFCRRLGDDVGGTHMCVLPVFHVNAFGFSFISTLYAGTRLVLNRRLHPPSYWEIVRREEVNVCNIAPSVMRVLCAFHRGPRLQLPSVRYATSSAGPLSIDLARRFIDKFGMRILQGYGLSEATNFNLMFEADLSDEAYEAIMFSPDLTSAGTPLFGFEMDVIDDDGRLLGEGRVGEIVIRGWGVFDAYLNYPEGTAQVLHDGWFRTGDLGKFINHAGRPYFYIRGRKKDIVKYYDQSVSLIEIEERLRREPGLENCAAVGFANDYAGEEIGLFVVASPETPAEPAILELCASIFPKFRRPKVVKFGGALPATSTGKVKRGEISPQFAAHEKERF